MSADGAPAVLFADEEKALPSPAPAKAKDAFRNYKDSARQSTVADFYRLQHSQQTYDFVCSMEAKYLSLTHFSMGIWDTLLYLDSLVDDSDPDTSNSQLQHALQTAESARRLRPDLPWMHVTGLIHDLGKILSSACHEPQWAVVGDTFPVGCAFSPQSVFPDSFALNPDSAHPVYSTPLGVYKEHCGLRNVKMSWGHDVYLAEVCVRNHCTLPPEALAMIRFHSFYPWHKHGAYAHLTDAIDEAMLPWVLEFNKCDLYSKDAQLVDVDAVKPYYDELIARYFPLVLKW